MTWRRENSWPYRDSNSDILVVQPVASRYTGYTIPAHDDDDDDDDNNNNNNNNNEPSESIIGNILVKWYL
jgi:hypothetical protein